MRSKSGLLQLYSKLLRLANDPMTERTTLCFDRFGGLGLEARLDSSTANQYLVASCGVELELEPGEGFSASAIFLQSM